MGCSVDKRAPRVQGAARMIVVNIRFPRRRDKRETVSEWPVAPAAAAALEKE